MSFRKPSLNFLKWRVVRKHSTIRSFLLHVGFLFLFFLSSCFEDPVEPNLRNYEDLVEEQDKYPAWSPNGEQIAYYHFSNQFIEPEEYPTGLYIIDKDGGNRRLVLEGRHMNPAWSPDGKWMVFSTDGLIQKSTIEGDSLTTFSGLNGQIDSFEDALFFPDWTPDGRFILFDRAAVFEGETNLFSMKVDFTEAQPIFGNIIPTGRDPELSPSQQAILFMRPFTSQPFQIFITNIDGSNTTQVTNDNRDNRYPTWSPKGQQIAWSSNVEIQVINIDGSGQRALDIGQYPSWSVNDQIVYSGPNADVSREVLYVINPDGTERRQITF